MTAPYAALFNRTALGIRPGLDVISDLLDAMGNPHHRLAAVHVAGTNGKGSVCAMIESVLRASGFRTGCYTSPHLIDFSERFRIDGRQIPADRLDDYIRSTEAADTEAAEKSGRRPATFFEISTAIAFQYFADEGVDIAVIETGMGGRWDATNVIIPLISVITRIDLDHAEYLGDTIDKIAAEKAGIIKPGRPVVTAPQSDEALSALRKAGEPLIRSDEAVSLTRIDKPQKLRIETHSRNLPPISLPLQGLFQRENCAVAVAALERLADLLDFEPAFKAGLESVTWSARFEYLRKDPPVILDGAHNPAAARALSDALREGYPRRPIGFILGFLEDKDAVGFVRALRPPVAKAWTVTINAPRGLSAAAAAERCRAAGVDATPLTMTDACAAARGWASEDSDRVVVITGSLYLRQELPNPDRWKSDC